LVADVARPPAVSALQVLRAERARFLLLFVIPLAVTAAICAAPAILNDGDTFWHVAAGRWMIEHGQPLKADPFSFTFGGRPWIAQEWLSEVVMAAAYAGAGWAGVMLLTGLAAGATSAVMLGWLGRWLSPLSAIGVFAMGAACVAPSLLARPHVVVLPLLAFWTVRLMEARQRGRVPDVWLCLLMALWANLHSSFIVGIGLCAAFGLEAALEPGAARVRVTLKWAAFTAFCIAAALATPQGIEGLRFPLRVMGMKALPSINEWRSADFSHPGPIELAFLAGVFVLFWRGARFGVVRAALLLVLVHLTFQHVRQGVLLGVVGPLLIAEPLAKAAGGSGVLGLAGRRAPPRPQAILAAVLFGVIVALRLGFQANRTDGPTAPLTALAHVPPSLRRQPVLNDYDFGGLLIFEGVRPFIDGRADMYGDAFVANDDALQRGDAAALAAAQSAYHLRWAILGPGRPLVAVLDRTPGWRRIYADRYAVVQALTP
jgi:hypothetical protein